MRQFLSLICATALCLSLSLGFPEKRRKSFKNKNYKIFDNQKSLEEITAMDAVFLPTPRSLKAPNLELIPDSDVAGRRVNTDDSDSYYFGDDINLTQNYADGPTPSSGTIFVTPSPSPSPSRLAIKHDKASLKSGNKTRKDLENVGQPLASGDTRLVTPQTLQSLYKSDTNNQTFKLTTKFPNTSANYFYQSDLYNKTLDQLFSSPELPPETSHEYPLTLIVKQSEGREEGLDINDHIANDIQLTPAFSYNDVKYSGKPQSLCKIKRYDIFMYEDVDV